MVKKLLLLLLLVTAAGWAQKDFGFKNKSFLHKSGNADYNIDNFILIEYIDNITLNWGYEKPEGVRGFYIYRGINGGEELHDSVAANIRTYVDGSTDQDSLYSYFVVAYATNYGALDSSEILQGYEKIFPPVFTVVPDTISADVIVGVMDELNYDSVRIFKGATASPTGYLLTVIEADSTYIDTPLTYTSPWIYRGIAYRFGRVSDYSSDQSVSVVPLRVSAAPTVTGGALEATVVVDEGLVDSVRLYRGTHPDTVVWITSLPPDTSYVEALAVGTYYYRTKNYKSGILSPSYSNADTAVVTAREVRTWYVDRDATGANDGTSWTDAWTTTDSVWGSGLGVNWEVIQGGDTIYISGGSDSTRYEAVSYIRGDDSDLDPPSFDTPVVLCPSYESGHDGDVWFYTEDSSKAYAFILKNISGIKFVNLNFATYVPSPAGSDNHTLVVLIEQADNNIFDSCLFRNSGTGGALSAGGENNTFEYCTIENLTNSNITDQDLVTIGYDGSNCGHTFRGNSIIQRSICDSTDAHPDFMQIGGAIGSAAYEETLFENNFMWQITPSRVSEYNSGIYISSGANIHKQRWTFINNIFVLSIADSSYIPTVNSPPALWLRGYDGEDSSDYSLRLYNNTFIAPGVSLLLTECDTLIAKNNVFIQTNDITDNYAFVGWRGYSAYQAAYLDVDYNHYYVKNWTSGKKFQVGDSFHAYDWAGWQALGYDTHSDTGAINLSTVEDSVITSYYTTVGRDSGVSLSSLSSVYPNIVNDILGNPRDSLWDLGALEYVAPASGHVTDQLALYWDYRGLSDGDVATDEWVDSVASLAIDANSDPNKTSAGIMMDGNDGFINTHSVSLGTGVSLETIVNLTDTITQQVVAGISDGTTQFTISLNNNAQTCLTIRGVDGGGSTFEQFYATPLFGTLAHLIVTFDGTGNDIKCYVNGTEQTYSTTGLIGVAYDAARVTIGNDDANSTLIDSGTIYKVFAVYNKVLSQDEVTQNYNYFADELSTVTGSDSVTSVTALAKAGTNRVGAVTLTWTDPTASNLDSVRIYRGTSSDTSSMTYVASVDEGVQTYVDSSLTSNLYYYALKDVDDASALGMFSAVVSDTVYEFEVFRYLDALTTALADSQKWNINSFVDMTKDSLAIDSLPQKFDVMYVLGNETEESALLNIVKRDNDATAVNSPTFTAFEGYTGANTKYLNTNYNPYTDSVRFTMNSATVGVYSRTDTTGSVSEFGAIITNGINLNLRNIGNNSYFRMQSTEVGKSAIISDTRGLFTLTRTASNRIDLYKTITSIANSSLASQLIENLNIFLLCYNNNGSPASYSYRQLSLFFISSGLTATEVRQLNNCIEAYMDGIGKGVQ